jgi:hypothetical protein
VYNKDTLSGIFLALAKIDFHINIDEKSEIGYRVRLRANIRAKNPDFLKGVARSLEQHYISTTYKDREHKSRPQPILIVGGIDNLELLCSLIPKLPDAKDEWDNFREAVKIVKSRRHLSQEGMDKLLELKGVL